MNPRRQLFSMLEIVAAGVILALLLATFMSLMQSLQKAQTRYVQESHAIFILDNVIERAAALTEPTEAELRTFLREEFEAAAVPHKNQLTTSAQVVRGRLLLRIIEAERNRTVAETEVPYEQAN